LDQDETEEQRKERFKTMEHMQSLCKAHIKNAQYVQKMNYSTWSLKRRARADLLKKKPYFNLDDNESGLKVKLEKTIQN
jgi:hypothetical protein